MTATLTPTPTPTEASFTSFAVSSRDHADHRHHGRRPRRILLWISLGALAVAGLLGAMGMVMASNANFSENYVTDQLTQQRITFKPVAALTDAERQAPCVVANAGQALTTGKQAECFANDYLGLHVKQIGKGQTYAEIGEVQLDLQAKLAAAQASGDPALADLQKQLGAVTGQREAVFKAEMLRGTLLTSFGFSTLGEKGAQAATAAYAGAGAMALLAMVGFVWATVGGRGRRSA